MKRDHALGFDALETRKLLTKVHVAAAHPATAVAATPVVITGTLTVNMKAATSILNGDSSTTSSAPVSGRLGSYGKVQGTWNETVDAFGAYEGPDWVQLQSKNPKGSFIIAFNNNNPGSPTPIGHGTGMYQHAQHLYNGTGAFAKATESGSIEVLENTKTKDVESLVLITASPQT